MATSGVTTWQLNRDSIISAALRKIAALSKGQTVDTYDTANGNEALNAMLKSFQGKGMPLWAISEYTFALGIGQKEYVFGVGQAIDIPAPLKVLQAYRTCAGNSADLHVITRHDYNEQQPQSSNTGVPVHLLYTPGNQTGTVKLWPAPDTTTAATTTITIMYQRPFEDMVSATDNLDFPQYWHEAVIYGLAWRLAPEYGLPIADRKDLEKQAMYHLEEAMSFGTEEGSLFFTPEWR